MDCAGYFMGFPLGFHGLKPPAQDLSPGAGDGWGIFFLPTGQALVSLSWEMGKSLGQPKEPQESLYNSVWLVVWNIFLFPHILGMPSSQLTNIFSEGFKPPTSYTM